MKNLIIKNKKNKMEELKNVRNYAEFKDSLNEELLWAAIKNLFSKVFGNMDKKLAASISEFTKRLDGSKSWDESVKIYEEFTKKDQAALAETLKTVYGPLGLRKVLYDNSSRVFLELQELSNKYQTPGLQAKNVFADKPEKDMFNYDTSEAFTAAAVEACNAKILGLNTTVKAYVDEAALKKYLEENKDEKIVQPAAVASTGTTTGTTESRYFNLNDYDKINEQVVGTPPAGNIEGLKTPATDWLTNGLYAASLEKVKATKPAIATALAGSKDPFTSVATGSKATANKENLAKLLRNIVNIPDTATLAKVRDAVGNAQGKRDFKNDIGVF